jgi:hypothetical protein
MQACHGDRGSGCRDPYRCRPPRMRSPAPGRINRRLNGGVSRGPAALRGKGAAIPPTLHEVSCLGNHRRHRPRRRHRCLLGRRWAGQLSHASPRPSASPSVWSGLARPQLRGSPTPSRSVSFWSGLAGLGSCRKHHPPHRRPYPSDRGWRPSGSCPSPHTPSLSSVQPSLRQASQASLMPS